MVENEAGSEPGEQKKNRLWTVDPSIYESHHNPPSLASRILSRLRPLGTLSLFSLLIVYPMGLIYIGLVYGWVGFWGTFLSSLAVLGLVLHRAGYAGNFRQTGNGNPFRAIGGLFLAFILLASFYEGLFILRSWVLPIVALLSTVILGYKLAKS